MNCPNCGCVVVVEFPTSYCRILICECGAEYSFHDELFEQEIKRQRPWKEANEGKECQDVE